MSHSGPIGTAVAISCGWSPSTCTVACATSCLIGAEGAVTHRGRPERADLANADRVAQEHSDPDDRLGEAEPRRVMASPYRHGVRGLVTGMHQQYYGGRGGRV